MAVVIRVTSGPHSGQEYLIDRRQTFMVGRSSRVHFPMTEDLLLSREHFRIENQPPLCHLMDLGSTNGTKVNGLRVERVLLREGDVITAGRQLVRGPFLPSRPATAKSTGDLRGLRQADPDRGRGDLRRAADASAQRRARAEQSGSATSARRGA